MGLRGARARSHVVRRRVHLTASPPACSSTSPPAAPSSTASAQVLAAVLFADFLPSHFIAFVDNEAGKFALRKGYGKDLAVNGILAAFWGSAAYCSRSPHFERMASKANISDEVSRGDLEASYSRGWRRVHTPIEAIKNVLIPATGDPLYGDFV